MKIMLRIGVFLFLVAAIFMLYKHVFRADHMTYKLTMSEDYKRKIDDFGSLAIVDQELILIGNSITDALDPEMIMHPKVTKMAISGDLTSGLTWRAAIVAQRNPQTVVIALGINDILYLETMEMSCFREYFAHPGIAKLNVPHAIVAIAPTKLEEGTFTDPSRINEEVILANSKLERFCLENKLEFIDVWAPLGGPELKQRYTSDGVHLTQEGYEVWSAQINKYLTE